MLWDEDISLLMCGAEIMSVNPNTTEYLYWYVVYNGNSECAFVLHWCNSLSKEQARHLVEFSSLYCLE